MTGPDPQITPDRSGTAQAASGACGASTLGPVAGVHIGPCVLTSGHDGPVHQDANGVQWAGLVGRPPEPAGPHRCDNCDGIDPASCVNAPTLRDRLADAILRNAWESIPGDGPDEGDIDAARDLADAVLPVVEAETGALTHLLRKTEDDLHDARTRAEQAEAVVQRARGLATAWRRVGKHGAADELDNTLTEPETP